MTDRPIIFSGPMIRALLEGRKTQTRRLALKPLRQKAVLGSATAFTVSRDPSPWQKAAPGDRLYVRESFWPAFKATASSNGCVYRADYLKPTMLDHTVYDQRSWTPSIHMPRVASRLTLVLTAVKIEPLKNISDEDALFEGVTWSRQHKGFIVPGIEHPNKDFPVLSRPTPHEMFAALWDAVHESGAWLRNPEVVAMTFRVHRTNIDMLDVAA